MSTPLVMLVEVTGDITRRGNAAKSGKPYALYKAFVHLPGYPYPQEGSFYAEGDSNVPQPGTYECDYSFTMKDGRPVLSDIDPRQGRRKNIPPLSAAMNAQKVG
ncbi:propanediol utilization protein [Pseudomonas syringae]|uniref:propanediol utilization protein n=1 Tax=Pseudomonas TaxID=286 RepID=UPI001F10C2A3|nr:propanediol utilization protein [Pseudomonas syringae]MCH5501626.1 propanediol utilization protein [Pseudomonas syringae pv. syringae]MCH5568108.1 propanediol utilization protein [Pseudomonas syringae pv. syringae]